MLKKALIERIGIDHYREACRSARREAEREDFGRRDPGNDDSSLTTHKVSDELWDLDASVDEKIELFFEIYDEMPTYTLLMYVLHHYPEWTRRARSQFWDHVRRRLGGPDLALARPLAYSLWCDWFEGGDFADEAWRALTVPGTSNEVVRHVLIASGPVPWAWKTALYDRLVGDTGWHYHIFRSLLHSAFDYYGDLDRTEASTWLDRLSLPDSTANLPELVAHLKGG